jgi:hypothetical protein
MQARIAYKQRRYDRIFVPMLGVAMQRAVNAIGQLRGAELAASADDRLTYDGGDR